jgi:serine/threonine kinase 38
MHNFQNKPLFNFPEMSSETKTKVEICKKFIEKKYQKNFEEEQRKKEYFSKVVQRMHQLNLNDEERRIVENQLVESELNNLRQKRVKPTIAEYKALSTIGKGAFGEVRLCRHLKTGELVAIKQMNKADMWKKNQLCHIRAERDILACSDGKWIVELKSSFTDDKYLYLVMEYLPGGDLMNLLIQMDVFTEEQARFYTAELLLAIESVHGLNYIHRDLKPDNVLIDKSGHLKLTDFGLCKEYSKEPVDGTSEFGKDITAAVGQANSTQNPSHKKVYSMVGTVDYIAPEVFGKEGYTETVDFWSLGTILFEMLLGYAPFYGNNSSAALNNVINFEKTFRIPQDVQLSPEAVDLMTKLITRASNRLGRNGVAEVKAHPFFKGIDWDNIRSQKAPVLPVLDSEEDTKNFETSEMKTEWRPVSLKNSVSQREQGVMFIGYTYKKPTEVDESQEVEKLLDALKRKKEVERKNHYSEERLSRVHKDSDSGTKLESNSKVLGAEGRLNYNFLKKQTANEYTEKGTKGKLSDIMMRFSAFKLEDKSGVKTAKKATGVLPNQSCSKLLERLKLSGRETEGGPRTFQKSGKPIAFGGAKINVPILSQPFSGVKKSNPFVSSQQTMGNAKAKGIQTIWKTTTNQNSTKSSTNMLNTKTVSDQTDPSKLRVGRVMDKQGFKPGGGFGKNLFSVKK